MGLHTMTNAINVTQGMHPSSALPMEMSVESAARTTTSKQSAGHHRDDRQADFPRC